MCILCPSYSSTRRDEVRRQNDLFLVADLTSLELALQTMRDETDTHWFATDGIGSFNWRIKFNVTLPMKKARLTLQVLGDLWCLACDATCWLVLYAVFSA